PLPAEGWNAQISLLTGMAAADLMLAQTPDGLEMRARAGKITSAHKPFGAGRAGDAGRGQVFQPVRRLRTRPFRPIGGLGAEPPGTGHRPTLTPSPSGV
ncbi:hypothetical protein, partial [Streptomyces sp. NPDC003483]